MDAKKLIKAMVKIELDKAVVLEGVASGPRAEIVCEALRAVAGVHRTTAEKIGRLAYEASGGKLDLR